MSKDRKLLRVHSFSDDRAYRYTLWRDWSSDSLEMEEREGNRSGEFLMVVGLNPSTADETNDDPTIRKCIGFAKRWGFGALCMTNLFAIRATDPRVMLAHPLPIGEANDRHLQQCAQEAGMIVCAWGTKGTRVQRDTGVRAMLTGITGKTLHCLRKTKNGHPEHPLYVPYTVTPIEFAKPEAYRA